MSWDRYRWLKKFFISPDTDFSGPDVTSGAVSLNTSLEYFQRYVWEGMIQQALTENTNVYSFQKNGTCLNTNTKEIEQMIGIYPKMGLMQMSGVWNVLGDRHTVHYCFWCDVTQQSLLTSLYFVNNLSVRDKEERQTLKT